MNIKNSFSFLIQFKIVLSHKLGEKCSKNVSKTFRVLFRYTSNYRLLLRVDDFSDAYKLYPRFACASNNSIICRSAGSNRS